MGEAPPYHRQQITAYCQVCHGWWLVRPRSGQLRSHMDPATQLTCEGTGDLPMPYDLAPGAWVPWRPGATSSPDPN